ncbi:MAG: hypothetical protein QMD88_08600 [Coprothermobacterota bacterium]|nr:hypothetical protein [Coprothermobacterota bacterium]
MKNLKLSSIVFLSLVLLLTLAAGCRSESKTSNSKVPFLVMTGDEESYSANLFYWDLEAHRILSAGETLYRLTQNLQDFDKCRPVFWDGAKNLILFPEAQPLESYAQTTKKIILDPELNTVVGQGVTITGKIEAGNKTYLVRAQSEGKTVEKELTISNYYLKGKDDKQLDVSQWGRVTAAAVVGDELFMLYPSFALQDSEVLNNLFVIEYNLKTEGLTWKQVKGKEELGIDPSLPPLANTVATISDGFVLTTWFTPAIVDLTSMDYIFLKNVPNTIKKIDPEVLKGEAGPVPIFVLGAYKGLVFTAYLKESKSGLSECYFAASDKDQIAGILHVTLNSIQILDEEGKVISEQEIQLSEKLGAVRSVYFPNVNGNFGGKMD